METKFIRRAVPLLLFFLLAASILDAQVLGNFVESRFVQRLAWRGDIYTSRYEVVIEKEEENENGTERVYREVAREHTEEPSISISLSPGKYRYMVIPYDFLNHPGNGSEWMNIEIRPVVAPEITGFAPGFLYLERGTTVTLNVHGKNLEAGAGMYLRRLGGPPVFPVEQYVSGDNTSARLLFESSSLTPGDYELVVRNPGGQEANRAVLAVVYPKRRPGTGPAEDEEPVEPVEIAEPPGPPQSTAYFGFAWAPAFPIYGSGADFFGKNPSFAGAGVRLTAVSNKPDIINFGFGFALSWHGFDSAEYGTENSAEIAANFLAQIIMNNQRTALRFRLGGGYSFPVSDSSSAAASSAGINMGASFVVFASKKFYMEADLDYMHFFEKTSGYFRPCIGFGFKN